MQLKIVITGGPGSGKTTIIEELSRRGYPCMPEISREIIADAQQKGIEQLFLTDPFLFSKQLLKQRKIQYEKAHEKDNSLCFFDRGIPDILGYLDFLKKVHPKDFSNTSKQYKYDRVFITPPWKEIHTTDNERYENFDQATKVYNYLKTAYQNLGYKAIEIPTGTVKERVDFILKKLSDAQTS